MLWMAIVGMLIGIGAMILMPVRDPVGVVVTILVGIAGSVVPAILGPSVGWYRTGDPAGIIGSVVGAVLLVTVHRAVLAHENTQDSGLTTKHVSH
jgi:uncharacterized membrane protein YeaQ/YmgE (transglycosylase-associated protein family)